MTQLEFSELSKKGIAENYPAFLSTINYKKDNSFDCILVSDKKMLSIWIATYNSEITLGVEDNEGKTDWHTHMNLFGANEPMEELKVLFQILDSIFSNQEVIVFSSTHGFMLTNDATEDFLAKDVDEKIVFYKWRDL